MAKVLAVVEIDINGEVDPGVLSTDNTLTARVVSLLEDALMDAWVVASDENALQYAVDDLALLRDVSVLSTRVLTSHTESVLNHLFPRVLYDIESYPGMTIRHQKPIGPAPDAVEALMMFGVNPANVQGEVEAKLPKDHVGPCGEIPLDGAKLTSELKLDASRTKPTAIEATVERAIELHGPDGEYYKLPVNKEESDMLKKVRDFFSTIAGRNTVEGGTVTGRFTHTPVHRIENGFLQSKTVFLQSQDAQLMADNMTAAILTAAILSDSDISTADAQAKEMIGMANEAFTPVRESDENAIHANDDVRTTITADEVASYSTDADRYASSDEDRKAAAAIEGTDSTPVDSSSYMAFSDSTSYASSSDSSSYSSDSSDNSSYSSSSSDSGSYSSSSVD